MINFKHKLKLEFFKNIGIKKFSTTADKMKNLSLYKRNVPKMGIQFPTRQSQELLKEAMAEGSASSFFQLMDQFQTQGDPTYCGPATMVCIFNSLGVDPKRKWKGYVHIIKIINF
jgi:hypothetical protein